MERDGNCKAWLLTAGELWQLEVLRLKGEFYLFLWQWRVEEKKKFWLLVRGLTLYLGLQQPPPPTTTTSHYFMGSILVFGIVIVTELLESKQQKPTLTSSNRKYIWKTWRLIKSKRGSGLRTSEWAGIKARWPNES